MIYQNFQQRFKPLELTPEEEAWLKKHPIIRIGADPDFAPYCFANEKGEYSGISADFIQIISERLGIVHGNGTRFEMELVFLTEQKTVR